LLHAHGTPYCFFQIIPARFHRHLPEVRAPVVLLCRGRSWTVSYCGVGRWRRLQGAWKDFARDNGLRLGDVCVFELVVPTSAGAETTEAAAATEGDENDSSSSSSSKDKEGKTMEVVFRVQVLRGGLPRRSPPGAPPPTPTRHLGLDPTASTVGGLIRISSRTLVVVQCSLQPAEETRYSGAS
jgi:hypothetical protein